ncbi:MAG TPA: hypothetical protein VJZ93_02705 [Candidatus Nanoarchaeia archaeon]|nr:hypothetical protein [Candidatus Nanoarchaeia archaeon]
MTNLINIVHPYTLSCEFNDGECTFVYGGIDKYEEKYKNIADFLGKSLDNNLRVLRHDLGPTGTLRYAMMAGAICLCPYLEDVFLDDRLIKIATLEDGCPRADKKPEKTDEKIWGDSKDLFISHSELKELIGNPQRTFYIGGFFEACVKNMAFYQRYYYGLAGDIFVIDDLCALTNDDKTQEVRDGLKSDGIKIISYEEALKLIQKN